MEGSSSGRDNAGNVGKADGMENLRLLRDMKYYEIIFELLARQYEHAEIDEAKDDAVIQVMDKAIEPGRKSKPKRSLIVILTALVVGFLACYLGIYQGGWRKGHARSSTGRAL